VSLHPRFRLCWVEYANKDNSGDKPLTDALELMNNEGITSLPVLDNQNNVIGNISHVDVRVCTSPTR
jgi:predicted transcriptional regulator